MTEETKIDKDYLKAFNLGYELAKELNLKSPMLEDLNSENSRINAMQAGMAQCSNEIKHGKSKEVHRTLWSDDIKSTIRGINATKGNGQDKGLSS